MLATKQRGKDKNILEATNSAKEKILVVTKKEQRSVVSLLVSSN